MAVKECERHQEKLKNKQKKKKKKTFKHLKNERF